jgi:outer membrane protein assembly factor BamB
LWRDWAATPPRLLWKEPVGGGYAGFAVAGNLLMTIEQRGGDEAVVGYDTASGGERWAYAYPALFSERMGGDGPRATPTIVDGRVYSLGATGRLVCLEAATGQRRWETDILEGDNLSWGMSGSPLVYDRFVVVSPGKQGAAGHTLVAYDRATGQKVWASGQARAGYSSPMLATLAGVRQILLFDGERLAGYDAGTGQELWHFDWQTQQDINVAQPLVLEGDRVFVTSGYGVGCAMLKVTHENGRWEPRPLWRKRTLRCKFTSPVALAGILYGLDEGVLTCIDEEKGERKWVGHRYGHGQLLLAGDLLLIMAETGELALVEASPAAFREVGRITVFEGKTWNCPALAGGKAYCRNDQEMAAYDLAAGASAAPR